MENVWQYFTKMFPKFPNCFPSLPEILQIFPNLPTFFHAVRLRSLPAPGAGMAAAGSVFSRRPGVEIGGVSG